MVARTKATSDGLDKSIRTVFQNIHIRDIVRFITHTMQK